MKKLLGLILMCAALAWTGAVSAACTTAPTVTGTAGVFPPAPNDWITSFYQYPSQPYAMKVWWSPGQSVKVSFGSGSDVTVLTSAACVVSTCSAFTGNRITTLYLPETTLSGVPVISVVANGVKVAEWYNVWEVSGASMKTATVTWSEGIVQAHEAPSPSSKLYFDGYHIDSLGVMHHKSVRAHLANACGSIE